MGYNNTLKEIFEEYDRLPLKNKLLLTNEKIIESKSTLAMNNGKKAWFVVMDNSNGLRYYEQFDYYKWFMRLIIKEETTPLNRSLCASPPVGGLGHAVTISFIISIEFLDNYDRFVKSEKIEPLTQYLRRSKKGY